MFKVIYWCLFKKHWTLLMYAIEYNTDDAEMLIQQNDINIDINATDIFLFFPMFCFCFISPIIILGIYLLHLTQCLFMHCIQGQPKKLCNYFLKRKLTLL